MKTQKYTKNKALSCHTIFQQVHMYHNSSKGLMIVCIHFFIYYRFVMVKPYSTTHQLSLHEMTIKGHNHIMYQRKATISHTTIQQELPYSNKTADIPRAKIPDG